MKKERSYNFLLVAGSALILVAVLLIVMALLAISPKKTQVLVPKADIQPYVGLSANDFIVRDVAKTGDSVDKNEFTQEYFKKKFKKGKKDLVFFSTIPLLQGQRIDNRVLLDNPQRSLSVVLSDESVITVTTTDAGAIGRSVRAGNVVNVSSNDANVDPVQFAKVLAIGPANQVSKVITGQDSAGATPGGSAQKSDGAGQLLVVLAVPSDNALALAGKDVVMSLVPFCTVDNQGYFTSLDKSKNTCEAPPEREASKGGDAAATAKTGSAATDTTATKTTPTDTTATTTTSTNSTATGPINGGNQPPINGGNQPPISGTGKGK